MRTGTGKIDCTEKSPWTIAAHFAHTDKFDICAGKAHECRYCDDGEGSQSNDGDGCCLPKAEHENGNRYPGEARYQLQDFHGRETHGPEYRAVKCQSGIENSSRVGQ